MIKIVGDINLTDAYFDTGFGVGTSIKQGQDPYQKIKRNYNDFWIGNFEGVTADTSNKSGVYKKQFIISTSHLSHIEHMDLYGVANNHVMQHGGVAYQEMLDYFESQNVRYVGTVDKKTVSFNHLGKKIGVMAFSQRPDNFTSNVPYWNLPEYEEIALAFENISTCDYKIAYIHWGNEFIQYPYIDQKQFAHWLVDMGFDLIVGMHPHVLQGYEVYKGKHIFYSLGNFVFNMAWEPTRYSIILNVDVENNFKISFDYVHIGKDYFPKVVSEEKVPTSFRFSTLNNMIAHKKENEIYYQEVFSNMKLYRKENYKKIIGNFPKLKKGYLFSMMKDFIKRRLKYVK